MPKKGHRAAARQAQLRDKKRRGKAAPQVFEAGPTESSRVAEEAMSSEEPERQAPSRLTSVAAAPRPARRAAQRTRPNEAPSYAYLRAELRRIAVVTIVILALLAVASFVLGS